jgi:chromosome segregation ATPase
MKKQLGARLADLPPMADLTTQVLIEIRDEVRRTNERLGATNERLDTTIQRLDTGQAATNERLERLGAGQAATNERLERLGAGQVTTNKRLEQLEVGQTVTNERLDGINNRLDRLERRQVDAEVRITTELVAVAGTLRELKDIFIEDRRLVGQVSDHERRIARLEEHGPR